MAFYLMPVDSQAPQLSSSCVGYKRGVGTFATGIGENATNGDHRHNGEGATNGEGLSNGEVATNGENFLNGNCATNGELLSNGKIATNGEHFRNGEAVNGSKHSVTNGINNSYLNGDSTKVLRNPTVIPDEMLRRFHFTFLIRHPRAAIPSYYRCTLPPLDKLTGFDEFLPSEAGYAELRRIFDYLISSAHVGPAVSTLQRPVDNSKPSAANGASGFAPAITIIDADDLLSDPEGVLRAYCAAVGIPFTPEMLSWDTPEEQQIASDAFQKWKGFHEDVLNSEGLMKKQPKIPAPSDEDMLAEWTKKFGSDAAACIKRTVDANVADYEYLKQFVIRPQWQQKEQQS